LIPDAAARVAGPETVPAITLPAGFPLWRRQVGAMIGLELKKTFLRARALPIVLLAFMPALLLFLRWASVRFADNHTEGAAEMATAYGVMFQLFFVRLVIFFGSFRIFTYLVRGEIAERSLHFYLLAPMRRDVFLAGKYLAGVIAGSALFLISFAVQLLLAFGNETTEGGTRYLFAGPGAGQAAWYALVVVLAVAGYGAVFLALGFVAKNPMIPAAAILGWEYLNFLLPPVLKKISVIHYLQSLCPVPLPSGPFALPSEPTPAPIAIGGLLLVIAALLFLAARSARKLQVLYAGE
jgi:ABC-type transport system involved in multi-copper enzyme maturation permease subunit